LAFALATSRFSAQKLRAIGLIAGSASANATNGGGAIPSSIAASLTTTALSDGSSSAKFSTRTPAGRS